MIQYTDKNEAITRIVRRFCYNAEDVTAVLRYSIADLHAIFGYAVLKEAIFDIAVYSVVILLSDGKLPS